MSNPIAEFIVSGLWPRRLKILLTHPVFHAGVVLAIVAIGWTIASSWERWSGVARLQQTDDAYLAGDLTPLASQISGYVRLVAVTDYQTVKAGDLIAEIDPADYLAQQEQSQGDLAAAKANLASVADKRAVQRTLIDQARATVEIAEAEVVRATDEDTRQRNLIRDGLATTQQLVEQADAAARKAQGSLKLARAQLDQQIALLTSLDATEKQLAAEVTSADARLRLAQDNVRYTRIVAPSDGMTAARQVRPGQFIAPGTQITSMLSLPKLWVVATSRKPR